METSILDSRLYVRDIRDSWYLMIFFFVNVYGRDLGIVFFLK